MESTPTYKKVFGIGLNKTGTTSLAYCLKRLGFKHMGCRKDLLEALVRKEYIKIFAEIDKYQSFEDWPYPLMFKELWERYGANARYILTERVSDSVWIESLKKHSLRTDPLNHCRLLAYGYNYPHENENAHLSFYNEHNQRVKNFFACEGRAEFLTVLSWERGDGWAELCRFLDLKQPNDPFPHENKAVIPDNDILQGNLDRIRFATRDQ
ncbi:MAG: sulfotransferase [Pseudomonadota bacterium]